MRLRLNAELTSFVQSVTPGGARAEHRPAEVEEHQRVEVEERHRVEAEERQPVEGVEAGEVANSREKLIRERKQNDQAIQARGPVKTGPFFRRHPFVSHRLFAAIAK